jgi:hypothetical protein
MMTPRPTEMVATEREKRSELKTRVGNVAGMLMPRALPQFARVKWPLGATGESDQKLPKTRAEMGRKIIKPRITIRTTSASLAALELYMAKPQKVSGLLSMRLSLYEYLTDW